MALKQGKGDRIWAVIGYVPYYDAEQHIWYGSPVILQYYRYLESAMQRCNIEYRRFLCLVRKAPFEFDEHQSFREIPWHDTDELRAIERAYSSRNS